MGSPPHSFPESDGFGFFVVVGWLVGFFVCFGSAVLLVVFFILPG